jgi:phthiocerol/phenolphthiocerol synthesis type-I polyketide synthase C
VNKLESISIVGAACRLPGAPDENAFAALLAEERFVVSSAPVDRWNIERFYHPRASERGFAYTFAGGYLPAPYDFDPTVFGMSPREATQLDPQQRLLAEVVWEALEDARIDPSRLAGTEAGVYLGVSALDHGNLFGADAAAIESHFMTGNTLSIVANRISYLFDLRGPSFAVDTACSSSLVAVDRAMADLRLGRIDTAIVAGVNMLLSPASFIGFSRASMLSPTGACRPFSADGDGYVRAEGAVAFILQRADIAAPGSIRAFVAGSGINSDGRTSGIALPGLDGQKSLLRRVYDEAELTPDDIAFVEAHGTGTAVGDPIEATAIGEVLGQGRSAPLPIGSVKSNIGHLEPASGVAGMMKALLALEARRLPATLHLHTRNPHIDFDALNLQPAANAVDLDQGDGPLHCGISSFGFGGTNAHAILRSAPRAARALADAPPYSGPLVISAACKEALSALAARHADSIAGGANPADLAAAVANSRQLQRHRAVLPLADAKSMAEALSAFAATGKSKSVQTGTAGAKPARICFVYSGNGAQWAGMGRTALARNPAFAARFGEVDALFVEAGMASAVDLLNAPDLEDKLGSAACVQPLLFAIQSSLTAALAEEGLNPDFVIGHSVGEIAAAQAAGILDLRQAVHILVARASCQEPLHGSGTMATFAADRDAVAEFLAQLDDDDIAIAADNGPASVTITGGVDSIRQALVEARRKRIAGRALDIDYPYHSHRLDGIRDQFLAMIGKVRQAKSRIPMLSTVTGRLMTSKRADAAYWWDNLRNEVLFQKAVTAAGSAGADLFIEISPRPILVSPVTTTLEKAAVTGRAIFSLSEADDDAADRDPIATIVARAIAQGYVPKGAAEAAAVDRSLPLPPYPWQRKTYRFEHTSEAVDVDGSQPRHPLIGARLAQGQLEWRNLLDAALVPYLADHRVGGEIVVPATALAEMALAVAREISASGAVALEDFDIIQALVLPAEGMREISVRFSETSSGIEIASRPRLGPDEWTLHARGRLSTAPLVPGIPPAVQGKLTQPDPAAIYQKATDTGIEYGPAFRLLRSLRRDSDDVMEVELAPSPAGSGVYSRQQILHPASLDAAFHGLFELIEIDRNLRRAWVPIRFDKLTVWEDHAAITSAVAHVERDSDQSKTISLWLKDAQGKVVARLDRALLRPVVLAQTGADDAFFNISSVAGHVGPAREDVHAIIADRLTAFPPLPMPEAQFLLRAHVRACAYRSLARLLGPGEIFVPEMLAADGRLAPGSLPFVAMLASELRAAGLLEGNRGAERLVADSNLPDPDTILSTFAAEYPLAATDLLLSAHAAAALDHYLETGDPITVRPAILARHEAGSLLIEPAASSITSAIEVLIEKMAPDRPHVLLAEPGGAGILARLLPWCAAGRLKLTVAGMDGAALERVMRRLPEKSGVETRDLTTAEGRADADLVVQLSVPSARISSDLTSRLVTWLRDGGAALMVHVHANAVGRFQLGMAEGIGPVAGVPAIGAPQADLDDPRTFGRPEDGTVFTLGRVHRSAKAPVKPGAPRLVSNTPGGGLETAIADLVAQNGPEQSPAAACSDLLLLADRAVGDDRRTIERAITTIRGELLAANDLRPAPRLWLITRGLVGNTPNPVAEAIWHFGRVALNEFSGVDIHLLDIAEDWGDAEAAAAIWDAISVPDREREIHLSRTGRQVLRVAGGLPAEVGKACAPAAMALDFPRRGVLENFHWIARDRVEPAADEIEVEIIASGLNFRDVMLAMGLLNDDVLDDGMAGAVYGFECAGRVVATGEAVSGHKVGDIVFGFGKEAFATHVTARQESFVTLPEGVPPEAGASIPVAFYTAWYSLVELAKLKAGERVLIHGGAGSVGLAAIQIARAIGAEIVATVSTSDKQALARLYGADHVYDSRSLAFADDVRGELGGVDVVLNSLAGDAMRAGIKCLKPFGRFVELGKRDYVANSPLALRPFRRNLSYFGVDVDQLLAVDPAITMRGLSEIVAGFAEHHYSALPSLVFEAYEIGSAFRMMQSAGHIGKIVVRPPRLLPAPAAPKEMSPFVPGDGVQLVVGGTQGFGLATALWLVEKGAKRIVVASRRGELDPTQQDRVAALRVAGITFVVKQVDVTSGVSVDALIASVASDQGPITGIYHTAMVLDDGLIRDMTPDRTAKVLAPKIDGAIQLDRATRMQPIQQFVLFSSASTLIGNPGQGAYVAANGYLQGLARQRRQEGLPALAICWGAIADVGVLAQRQGTAESLRRVSGVAGMQSRDALAGLGRLLAVADRLTDPVVVCAEFQRDDMFRSLPILATPAFADIFGGGTGGGSENSVDIATLIADKSDAEAQRILGRIIADEVAQILRLSAGEVDLDSSLDALGMDSLMALELRMGLETRYNIELPLMSITSVPSLRDLTKRLLQSMRPAEGGAADPLTAEERELIAIHSGAGAPPATEPTDNRSRLSVSGQ